MHRPGDASLVEPAAAERLRRWSFVGGGALIALGALVLFGWALGIPALKSLRPWFATMKPNTALMFALLGAGFLLGRPAVSRARSALAASVIALAGLTALEYLAGVDLGIDQLLFADNLSGTHPGRPAGVTTFNFLLLGTGLLSVERNSWHRLADAVVLPVYLTSFAALCGYFFGVPSLYKVDPFSTVALHTAIAFLIAALALSLARPTVGLAALIASNTSGGLLLRKALPFVCSIPVLLGWLGLRGQDMGLFDTRFGVAILTVFTSACISVALLLAARSLRGADLRRRHLEAELADSEAMYRDLYDDAPDMCVSASYPEGVILMCNDTVARRLGYAKSEMVGRSIRQLYSPRTMESMEVDRPTFVATGELHDVNRVLLCKNGESLDVSLTLRATRDAQQNIVGVKAIWRDVTERRKAERDYLRVGESLRQREEQLRALNADLEQRVALRTAELSTHVKEREVLLQEVHHRVKNNLQVVSSLVNMQLRKLTEPQSRAALEECQTRVQAMALIHEKLYQSRDYGHVPFADYALSLGGNVFQAVGVSPSTVDLRVEMADLSLPVAQAIPCGLILNELITNALKHAFPADRKGVLRATLERYDERVVLTVSDDGVGMPAGFVLANAPSLGMQLVATLVEQLEGELELSGDNGTTIRVGFPVAEPYASHAPTAMLMGEQFLLAIEAAPSGMLMVDAAGKMLLVNDQIERLFGYAREELIGQPVEMLVPERFRGRHPTFRADFRRGPKARLMGGGRDLYGLRKDGTEVPIEIGLNPLRIAERDFVLSSVADITERKRAERDREQLMTQLQALNTDLEARVGERTAALTASLREREVLLQEVHHRVKNNLQVISSLISMQVRKLEEGVSRDALAECQTRVQAIALIHEKLYQSKDYAHVPFSEYARSLAGNVFHASDLPNTGISLDLAIDDVALPVDEAIPCGLVLNELITNALKHAFKGRRTGTIRVELTKIADGRLRLAVKDDGVGLPRGFDVKTSESLGLQLVCTLSEQLEAELDVNGKVGAAFQLTFPMRS